MRTLKQAIETFDDSLFSQLLNKDHVDSGEVLMILYASVVCFNAESAFDILLKRDNYFASKPTWHLLFSQKRVFPRLQLVPVSPERRSFDLLTLKEAYDKDLSFMSELVLERARITKEVIDVMLREDQKNAIVGLISRRPRPKWIEGEDDGVVEHDIQFNDIVKAALECKEGSQAVIQLIKRMKNEVHS
jgi:hypothetical protein